MTFKVDLYYSMRSPYCYLSTFRLAKLVEKYDLFFNLKPVYPLAITDPGIFKRSNPLWPAYLLKDTARIARRLGVPYEWPRPDPIVQNFDTLEICKEQPLIGHLTRLAQVAAEMESGLEYIVEVSGMLFHPDSEGWDTGTQLTDALTRAGLELEKMHEIVLNEEERLESTIRENREQQLAAGHWGSPLFVFEDESFFGQDRIEDLLWFLLENGLKEKGEA